MTRATSEDFREEVYAEQTGDAYITRVEITHEDLPETLRLASGYTRRLSADPLIYGIRSEGHDWLFVGMTLKGPDRKEGAVAATLSLRNLDQGLIAAARSTITQARVDLSVVRTTSLDFVQWATKRLLLTKASYNDTSLTLEISLALYTGAPYPAHRMPAGRFPAVHSLIR